MIRSEERVTWLESLKAGDRVAVYESSYGRRSYRIRTIERRTPSGRFVLEGIKAQFDTHGREMGSRGSGFCPSWREIVPITDEVRESIARERALEALRSAKFESLTTESLVKLHKALAEAEKLPSKDSP